MSKKIKCDESRPECKQCLKRKVACPGYKRDLKWSDKHEVYNIWSPKAPPAQASATYSPTQSLSLSESVPTVESVQRSRPIQPAQSAAFHSTTSQGSSIEAISPVETSHRHNNDRSSVVQQVTVGHSSTQNARPITGISRDDLRDWFVSYDPMPLLEHQDRIRTFSGSVLSCETPSSIVTMPDFIDTSSLQGGESTQVLVQYFFDKVCLIHTVLDDTAGPFEALVRRYLSSSPLLHRSVVCMAAAHCFQDEESMLPMVECHTAAVRSLSQAVFEIESVLGQSTGSPRDSALDSTMLRKLEITLLASIILGFCAVCLAISPISD